MDSLEIEYNEKIDFPPLYKKVSSSLNLHPKQHEEKTLKQILEGCSKIITGLGELRNKQSDSHGGGRKTTRNPAPRHSELAVNLAGSMASFLIQTFENKTQK